MEFNRVVDIFKVDNEKHIVYGKALVPNKHDSQGDIVSKADVEEAAHNFLIQLQKSYESLVKGAMSAVSSNNPEEVKGQIGVMHRFFKGVGGFGYVVESYIDPTGSWVLGTKINDETIWKMVKSGQITGYSIGGKGIRIPEEDDLSEPTG